MPIPIEDPGVDLARKAVCIKVRLSRMGNMRKVSTTQIEADADKDLLRVSKHLLDSAELKAITRFDAEIRRYLYNICLPFEVGIHLLPIAALETVEQRLRQFATDRQQLAEAFLVVYPSLCQDAARRLRGLYNPADYPPVEEARRQFGFSWQYVSFGVPDQLKGISQEVWEQEREKAAQRMAEASSEIQIVLRESMAKLVQHMAERLKTSDDGKPLRFKESTVSNLIEFLANFEFRNVTDDTELQSVVAQAAHYCKELLPTSCGRPARSEPGCKREWQNSPPNWTRWLQSRAAGNSASRRTKHDPGFCGGGARRLRRNA